METYQETLQDCIQELKDVISYYSQDDEDFNLEDYIDNFTFQDDLFSIIDGCVSVYDDDIIDIFKSEQKLKYMDDEFGGDTVNIIQKMNGVIHQSLMEDIHEWIQDDDIIEELKELTTKEETNE